MIPFPNGCSLSTNDPSEPVIVSTFSIPIAPANGKNVTVAFATGEPWLSTTFPWMIASVVWARAGGATSSRAASRRRVSVIGEVRIAQGSILLAWSSGSLLKSREVVKETFRAEVDAIGGGARGAGGRGSGGAGP